MIAKQCELYEVFEACVLNNYLHVGLRLFVRVVRGRFSETFVDDKLLKWYLSFVHLLPYIWGGFMLKTYSDMEKEEKRRKGG